MYQTNTLYIHLKLTQFCVYCISIELENTNQQIMKDSHCLLSCLSLAPPKADSETRIFTQAIYLKGDPKNTESKVGEVRQEREGSK